MCVTENNDDQSHEGSHTGSHTIHKMQRVRSNIECERTWCQHLTQGSVRVSDALHCCVVYDGGMKPDEDFADAQL